MGLILAGVLAWAFLWVIGTIMDNREQDRRDQEFWDRWHEKRRP